ncbi:Mpo1-like protein [Shewanella sp. Isolate11]|uniref:Mpo1 family 2-hydroxy fatty acid dioxygenase n=1 Tax=Shewanella sp. Isolate11 TaxID=2908530 RepID=UPI001EFD20A7|nr:Mpo1-like protein [Shewanella sp. Isolate11]MCG9695950.1 DUF962 domain-containing protein [Shewanella sp. Isolate11]
MKSAVEQLSTYKSVHLNPTNIKSHFVGVPLIIWSVYLILNLIPASLEIEDAFFNAAGVFTLVVLAYYFILHTKIALGLTLFILPVLYTSYLASKLAHAWWLALAVFLIGWIIQLIGHKYEKAKPAFMDDINQLVIGPFFLMAELYFMLGLEPELHKQITPLAIAKRRAMNKSSQE